jgi:hypothetical protein
MGQYTSTATGRSEMIHEVIVIAFGSGSLLMIIGMGLSSLFQKED